MTRNLAPARISKRVWMCGAAVAGAAVLAANAGSGTPTTSLASSTQNAAYSASTSRHGPTFATLDDAKDPTFNQLLGINNGGRISGYFGSGADAAHPNQGYTLVKPYGQGNFIDENVPGSVQTQVIGINNTNVTVGFFIDPAGATFGFVRHNGRFTKVSDPHAAGTTLVTQLLGVNDNGVAAGFYNDAAGAAHGFTYDIARRTFHAVHLPVAADAVTVTGINDHGDLSGFYVVGKSTFGFESTRGHFRKLSFGAASNTQALGINAADQVVGSYVDTAGTTRGFLWSHSRLTTISSPTAVSGGGTVINGLNDRGQLVGFYVDAAGNTNGLLARVTS